MTLAIDTITQQAEIRRRRKPAAEWSGELFDDLAAPLNNCVCRPRTAARNRICNGGPCGAASRTLRQALVTENARLTLKPIQPSRYDSTADASLRTSPQHRVRDR